VSIVCSVASKRIVGTPVRRVVGVMYSL
jgi:hypothetical protein